ncbi:hypothetical protein MANI_028504 [Metarhizium anisopliae]|nr:hypothetical protein MANI_028504 [Metarhizium anisopliae]
MASHAFVFLVLFLIPELCLAQTVTITKDIPSDAHKCVRYCLIYPGFQDDLGGALACGIPYKNDCYCATEVASASKASSWIERCAKEQCLVGDLNKDRTSMQNIYAGYCKDAGLPQPSPQSVSATATATSKTLEVSSWPPSTSLNSSDGGTQPSKTDNTGSASVATTQTTVVTQTKASSAGVGIIPQVTVQATSTMYVMASDSEGTPTAVKAGLGVAIPVVVLAIAGVGFYVWHRRRRARARANLSQSQPGYDEKIHTTSPGGRVPLHMAESFAGGHELHGDDGHRHVQMPESATRRRYEMGAAAAGNSGHAPCELEASGQIR